MFDAAPCRIYLYFDAAATMPDYFRHAMMMLLRYAMRECDVATRCYAMLLPPFRHFLRCC